MSFLLRWLISALAIMITAYLLPGVRLSGVSSALLAALVLGLVNTFLRPLLLMLTLPLNVVTLGLLTFVINALLIMLTSAVVPGFRVEGFLWALIFSLVLSLVSFMLGIIAL